MIIAEVGLNHLGNEQYAHKYVEILAQSSLDAVTFQIREPEYYQKEQNHPLQLSTDCYMQLARALQSADKKVGFGICSLDALPIVSMADADFIKILSWAIADHVLLEQCFIQFDGHIFVSTGTSSLADLEVFLTKWEGFRDRITLIHTQLSHELCSANLSAIDSLRLSLEQPIAYGHHSVAPEVLHMSLCFQPESIFFYVIGDRKQPHPDHEHAIPITEVADMTNKLKSLSSAVGTGKKVSGENQNKKKWK